MLLQKKIFFFIFIKRVHSVLWFIISLYSKSYIYIADYIGLGVKFAPIYNFFCELGDHFPESSSFLQC